MKTRIAMIGAGSGFSLGVATPLCKSGILRDATFVLMDPNAERVENMGRQVRDVAAKAGAALQVETTTDLRRALEGARFVVSACEKNRGAYWIRDMEIPAPMACTSSWVRTAGPAARCTPCGTSRCSWITRGGRTCRRCRSRPWSGMTEVSRPVAPVRTRRKACPRGE